MKFKNKYFVLIVIAFLIFLTSCETAVVIQPKIEKTSMVCFYATTPIMQINSIILRDVNNNRKYYTIKTNNNDNYKKYFPIKYKYKAYIGSNISPGTYTIRFTGKMQVRGGTGDVGIEVPKDIYTVSIKQNGIFYLGDFMLIAIDIDNVEKFDKKAKELRTNDFFVESFISTLDSSNISFKRNKLKFGLIIDGSKLDSKIMRPGEYPFYDLLIKEKFSGWSELAQKQLDMKKQVTK